MITELHHVQLAMPEGGEAEARRFYGEILGMTEMPKPAALAGRGGCWFRAGTAELHLGVEKPFRPARKAHPTLVVTDLQLARRRLEDAGCPVRDDRDLPGIQRIFTEDPFGNRIELLRLVAGA